MNSSAHQYNLMFGINASTYIMKPSIFGVNPFPHIDAFWRLCSRRPFANMATKEEIAQTNSI